MPIMCLLSVYSPGAPVVTDHLANGAQCNPDGFGFAVVVGDRIETGHGMEAPAVIEAFDRVRTVHPHGWALFHSRYTTDGATSVDNCHPFIVGGDARTVLAHNGVLPSEARPVGKDQRSDTRILAETLIPRGRFGKLHRARSRGKLAKWLLKDGYLNKVAILTVDPMYQGQGFILNEHLGDWEQGVWHSNDAWMPRAPRRDYWDSPSTWEDSTEYGAYLAGETTLAEYIRSQYQGSNPDDCDMCEAKGTMNPQYGYCTTCKMCADCFSHIDACDCWPGAPVDNVRAALSDTGTPMALDASVPNERC